MAPNLLRMDHIITRSYRDQDLPELLSVPLALKDMVHRIATLKSMILDDIISVGEVEDFGLSCEFLAMNRRFISDCYNALQVVKKMGSIPASCSPCHSSFLGNSEAEDLEFLRETPRNTSLSAAPRPEFKVLIKVGERYEVTCKTGSYSSVFAGKVHKAFGNVPTISASPFHKLAGLMFIDKLMEESYLAAKFTSYNPSSTFKELVVLPSGRLMTNGKGCYTLKDFGKSLQEREKIIAAFPSKDLEVLDDATMSYLRFASSAGQWVFPWGVASLKYEELEGSDYLFKSKFGGAFNSSIEMREAMLKILRLSVPKSDKRLYLTNVIAYESASQALKKNLALKLPKDVASILAGSRTPVPLFAVKTQAPVRPVFAAYTSYDIDSDYSSSEESGPCDVTTQQTEQRQVAEAMHVEYVEENGMVYVPISKFTTAEKLKHRGAIKNNCLLVTKEVALAKGFAPVSSLGLNPIYLPPNIDKLKKEKQEKEDREMAERLAKEERECLEKKQKEFEERKKLEREIEKARDAEKEKKEKESVDRAREKEKEKEKEKEREKEKEKEKEREKKQSAFSAVQISPSEQAVDIDEDGASPDVRKAYVRLALKMEKLQREYYRDVSNADSDNIICYLKKREDNNIRKVWNVRYNFAVLDGKIPIIKKLKHIPKAHVSEEMIYSAGLVMFTTAEECLICFPIKGEKKPGNKILIHLKPLMACVSEEKASAFIKYAVSKRGWPFLGVHRMIYKDLVN